MGDAGQAAPDADHGGDGLAAGRLTLFDHVGDHSDPGKLAVAKSAGVDVPLTEEIAADIFMGTFTRKFAEAARITARALRCFPLLAGVNIVRSWGALRVMSPDGLPIYEASTRCPGAFVASCHSGITLAAQHAGALVAWMRGGAAPAALAAFGSERFDVQAA